MKLMIDINEEIYKKCKWKNNGVVGLEWWERAIANGIPLLKGHGRLIDESQITGTFIWDNGYIECYAPTIIEADESEGE